MDLISHIQFVENRLGKYQNRKEREKVILRANEGRNREIPAEERVPDETFLHEDISRIGQHIDISA